MKQIITITIIFLFTSCISQNTDDETLTNINVIRNNREVKATKPSIATKIVKIDTIKVDSNKVNSNKVNTVNVNIPKVVKQKIVKSLENKYFIIYASYPPNEKHKADTTLALLKKEKINAIILTSKQRVRVALGTYPDEASAIHKRDLYKKSLEKEDLWILKQ